MEERVTGRTADSPAKSGERRTIEKGSREINQKGSTWGAPKNPETGLGDMNYHLEVEE